MDSTTFARLNFDRRYCTVDQLDSYQGFRGIPGTVTAPSDLLIRALQVEQPIYRSTNDKPQVDRDRPFHRSGITILIASSGTGYEYQVRTGQNDDPPFARTHWYSMRGSLVTVRDFWQPNGKTTPLTQCGIQFDFSAMDFDDAMADRQP